MKRHELRRTLIGIFACVWIAGCGGARDGSPNAATKSVSADTGPRPDVVFILIDTLRADRLGVHDEHQELSPVFDEIAREGVIFERAMATAPWTLASVASIFSGFYPTVHKATDYRAATGKAAFRAGQVRSFSEDFHTLAEGMQAAGYQTAAISANPFIAESHGFAQGFDHFEHLVSGTHAPGNVVNDAALKWLKGRDPKRPFFLYVHYMDPHAPYRAANELLDPLLDAVEALPERRALSDHEQKKYRSYYAKSFVEYADNERHRALRNTAEYWGARYDAGVRQMDAYLDAFRDGLRELGVWDDALLILTADHGEALGEHEIWGHGTSAYQDQLHVPLVLRWKGHFEPRRVGGVVRHFDVYPTIFDTLGLKAPSDLQSASLRTLLEGGEEEGRMALAEAVNTQPTLKSLIVGDWKLLYHTDGRPGMLFRLRDDPGETRNLWDAEPGERERMIEAVRRILAENERRAAEVQEKSVDLSPEEIKRLEALGYTGAASEGDADEPD